MHIAVMIAVGLALAGGLAPALNPAIALERSPVFLGLMAEEAPAPKKRAGKPPRAKEHGKDADLPPRAAKPRPRGSSTYIPPPVPSPNAANSPPPPPALAPGPGVHQPLRLNTFGDRVTNCIHSAPLNAGIGNNPADRQAYIRQCAN
jgi:hypothetical protein